MWPALAAEQCFILECDLVGLLSPSRISQTNAQNVRSLFYICYSIRNGYVSRAPSEPSLRISIPASLIPRISGGGCGYGIRITGHSLLLCSKQVRNRIRQHDYPHVPGVG